GQPFTDDEIQARRRASRRAAEIFEDIDSSNDLSFADALKNEPDDVRRSGRSQSRMATGEEDRYVSVADWQQLASGSNLTVPGGYGALAEKIAAALPVRTGVRVTEIDWSGSGVRVVTDQGDIRARYAIVTVSVGVLQKAAIRFTPALPAPTIRALSGLKMGALTKIGLRFEGTRLGFNPYQFLIEAADADKSMSFECWPQDQDVVVAVTGGDYARELTWAGEQAAVETARDTFIAIAGGEARTAFRAGRLAGWAADPFAEGSYSVLLPGRSGAREALARPVGNRLWFAGEASAGTYAMTAGGATFAGQTAATEIAALASRRKT
ncbi:MAG: flavin monoamine oxidase family protein, partial [Beijerinckiaceae bacterium]